MDPVPYISDAALRLAVASALGVDVSELAAKWDEPITAANKSAAGLIDQVLSGKGFTRSQIAAWDRVRDFNRYLGLLFCGNDGAFVTAYGREWAEGYARWEKDLNGLTALVINRQMVYPGSKTSDGGGTQIGGGELTGSVPGRDWTCTEF